MGQRSPELYHFTCHHGFGGVSKTGLLLPAAHPLMPGLGPLVWLTDLASPSCREVLGLTSDWLSCDRMAFRYVVHTRAAVRWVDVRARVRLEVVAALEAFGEPEHWWVARRRLLPSEFRLDERWDRSAWREVAG